MLIARLERIEDEYYLRVPRSTVAQLDIRDGQFVAVSIEPLDELASIDGDEAEKRVEGWKLNEPGSTYRPE